MWPSAEGIMSAPIREPDDEGLSKDGPLNYAPRRARRQERHPDIHSASGKGAAANAPRKHDAVDASRKGVAVDVSRKGDAAALEKSASADAPRKGDAASAPRKNDTVLQRGVSEPPVPPWKRKKQPEAFAGDA